MRLLECQSYMSTESLQLQFKGNAISV